MTYRANQLRVVSNVTRDYDGGYTVEHRDLIVAGPYATKADAQQAKVTACSPRAPREGRRMKRLVGEHFTRDGRPKRRFPTRAAAEEHARRHWHSNLDVYECSVCQGFHFATRRRVPWLTARGSATTPTIRASERRAACAPTTSAGSAIPCSTETGYLVERHAPALERKRKEAKAKRLEREQRQREQAREKRTAREVIDGVNVGKEIARLIKLPALRDELPAAPASPARHLDPGPQPQRQLQRPGLAARIAIHLTLGRISPPRRSERSSATS